MARKPSQADLNRVAEKARTANTTLAGLYADGQIDAGEFGDRFATVLVNRHSAAATLGRKRAGSLGMDESRDRAFGAAVVEGERPYIDAFVEDLKTGRYAGEGGAVNREALEKRMDLYVGRIVGTANEAFSLSSYDDEKWYWEMGETEEHCEVCPEREAGSPYTRDTLPGVPMDNSTPCLWNCGCTVKREDGLVGFTGV